MTTAVVVDFLHVVATVAWIGGMLFLKLVLLPAQQAVDPAQRGRLMGAVAGRFTVVAWSCVAVLLVTGFLKTPADLLLSTASGYGTMLLVKHALFAVMIAVGLAITCAVAPRLRALAPGPGGAPSGAFLAAQRRLDVLSAVNTVLGVAVLFAVAALG